MHSNNKWMTEVKIPKPKEFISISQPICSIGSCFSQNISNYLKDRLIDIEVSPFGVSYNPISICTILNRIIQNLPINSSEIIKTNRGYTTWTHHSSKNHSDREAFIKKANEGLDSFHQKLKSASTLFITLGSAYYYEEKKTGVIVNNCHQYPASEFTKKILPIEIMQSYIDQTLKLLENFNQNLKIIWTISPVKYLNQGGLENFLSKSILRVGLEPILNRDKTSYFPAYEIQVDELRDYRFYDESKTHPSRAAIEEICQRFLVTYIHPNDLKILEEWQPLYKFAKHQNLSSMEETEITHKNTLHEKINMFATKHPKLKKRVNDFLQNLHSNN